MGDILIYVGLSFLLIGCVASLCLAIVGWKKSKGTEGNVPSHSALSRYYLVSRIPIFIGFIIVAIGIAISAK